MSINKLISIDNPVIDALDFFGADHNKEKPVFVSWAVKAEKRISSARGLRRKRTVVSIKGCVAEIPSCAVVIERAILGDHGCDCDDLFISIFSGATGTADQTSMDSGGFLIVDLAQNSVEVTGIVPYQVQDNKIIFMKSHDGESVTIQYLGYETDEKGFIKISENHVEAIEQFIKWKYIERSRFGPNPQKRLPYEDKKDAEREWHRLCSDARAKDSELSEAERMEIAALLSNPYSGRGMLIGMSTYPNFYC